MPLAQKLKALRRKEGESLQQVADEVGVSKAHIWELETGKSTNPGLELLLRLADHFSVTVAFLADEQAAPEDARVVQFCNEFSRKLSEKDWTVLRAVAERLATKQSKS